MASNPRRWRNTVVFLAKCGIAALLVLWLIHSGQLDLRPLFAVRLDRLILGMLLGQIAMMVVPLVRWCLLVRARCPKLSFGQTMHIGLISYFAVLLLPATGGMETVRFLYARPLIKGYESDFAGTLIVDRITGLMGLCALGVASGLFVLIPGSDPKLMKVILFVAVIFIVLMCLLVALIGLPFKPLTHLFVRWKTLGSLFEALQQYRYQKGILFVALALSCVGHLGSCSAAYFAFLSLSFPAPLPVVVAVNSLVNLSAIVPLTPLGLGVADSIAASLYSLVGIARGAEVTMLQRGVTVLLSVLCGLAYLLPVTTRERIGVFRNLAPDSPDFGPSRVPTTAPLTETSKHDSRS